MQIIDSLRLTRKSFPYSSFMPKVRRHVGSKQAQSIVRQGQCMKLPVSLKQLPPEHFACWGDRSFRARFQEVLPPPSSELNAYATAVEQELESDLEHSEPGVREQILSDGGARPPSPSQPPRVDKASPQGPSRVEVPADDPYSPAFKIVIREPTPDNMYPSPRSVSPHIPAITALPPFSPVLSPSSPPTPSPDSPPQHICPSPMKSSQFLHVPQPCEWRLPPQPPSLYRRSRLGSHDDQPQSHGGGSHKSLVAAVSMRELLPVRIVEEPNACTTPCRDDIRIADVDVDPSQSYFGRQGARVDPYRRPVTMLPSLSQLIVDCERSLEEFLPSFYRNTPQCRPPTFGLSHRQTSHSAHYSE